MQEFDEQSFDAATDGADETSRNPAEIRIEIEETRADLAQTVEAIEQKLRPSAVAARAAESVKESAAAKVHALTGAAGDAVRTAGGAAQRAVARTSQSAGEVAGGVMGMVRENPIPAALIAIGTGWLLANAGGSRRRVSANMDSSQTDRYWREMNTHGRSDMDIAPVRRGGRHAQAYLQRMTSENPLLVGAGALLIGAAFGLALPETQRENELMGEARDSLVDRAQQVASHAAERLQEQASGVADAAGGVADSLRPSSQG